MKIKLILTLLIVSCFFVKTNAQINISGTEIPKFLTIDSHKSLPLYGAAARKILWIDVYLVSIFINESNHNAQQLIHSNETMVLRLYMKTSLVSKSRLKMAIERGFKKSQQNNYTKYKNKVENIVDKIEGEIEKNDVVDLVYLPSGQTKFYINERYLGRILGIDFKQALFSIWLSENCIDQELKNQIIKGT